MMIEILATLVLAAAPAVCEPGGPSGRLFVEFADGDATIDSEDAAALDALAARAPAESHLRVRVHGFADGGQVEPRSAWRPEDVALAERRSRAVVDHLYAGGFPAAHIGHEANGFRGTNGETRTGADGRSRYTGAVVLLSLARAPWTGPGPQPAC